MAVFPEYFLIYTVLYYIFRNNSSLKYDIVAFPFQLTLTYGFEFYGHIINWGAWFFSLIFMCYFIAPYFINMINSMDNKLILLSAFMCMLFVSCGPYLQVMIYANFFMRFYEFYIGMVLAWLYLSKKESFTRHLNEAWKMLTVIVLYIVAFVAIYFMQIIIEQKGLNHTFLSPLNIIMVSGIVYMAAKCEGKLAEAINNNYVISVLSKYSLEIYGGTFFSSYIYATWFVGKYSGAGLVALAFFFKCDMYRVFGSV